MFEPVHLTDKMPMRSFVIDSHTWSQWSSCSKSCGEGVKIRFDRSCQDRRDNGDCAKESKFCFDKFCPGKYTLFIKNPHVRLLFVSVTQYEYAGAAFREVRDAVSEDIS